VLKAVGALSPDNEARLIAMEPKLREIYRKNGSWTQILSSVMEFPNNMPEMIEQMWRRNQEIARAGSVSLEPQHFAEMFVDNNFGEK
jgi:hypothetical protein